MKDVFVVADNIFSPLGSTTAENLLSLNDYKSGVKTHGKLFSQPSVCNASLFAEDYFLEENNLEAFTRFEKMLVHSIEDALKESSVDIQNSRTIIVISSTKGNISLLETTPATSKRNHALAITTSAKKVADWFGNPNQPIVVSNACISGMAALLVAKRYIQSGRADHAIVTGADCITRFVYSGFEALQALSPGKCMPFVKHRSGINLGEAAATIILSKQPASGIQAVCISGGAISNDANHLTGPSRTGQELAMAIQKAMKEATLHPSQIGFVSAHGTATQYNDQMEANALSIVGLRDVPVNSLKGYFGHTLGAAGLLESVVTVSSMRDNIIFPTYGFQHHDDAIPLNVIEKMGHLTFSHALKIASGFGGCNAALVFSKCNNN